MKDRDLFRLVLALILFHYVQDAIGQVPGDFWVWLHLVAAVGTAPVVYAMAWRYSS